MKRQKQIRAGGRWVHVKSGRLAVIVQIVYPHTVEYKYAQPIRSWSHHLHYAYMSTIPFVRRTRVPYRRFILSFRPEKRGEWRAAR